MLPRELQYIPGRLVPARLRPIETSIQFPSRFLSLEISRSHEFLTGRKIEFRITPFTFPEWLGTASQFSYPRSISIEPLAEVADFYQAHRSDLETHALTYLNWGGYPEPAFEPPENKLQISKLSHLLQSITIPEYFEPGGL
jgi:predicted AAA+ superfamily ATPase